MIPNKACRPGTHVVQMHTNLSSYSSFFRSFVTSDTAISNERQAHGLGPSAVSDSSPDSARAIITDTTAVGDAAPNQLPDQFVSNTCPAVATTDMSNESTASNIRTTPQNPDSSLEVTLTEFGCSDLLHRSVLLHTFPVHAYSITAAQPN